MMEQKRVTWLDRARMCMEQMDFYIYTKQQIGERIVSQNVR